MMEESRQQICFETLFDRCPNLESVNIGMRDGQPRLRWEGVKEFREVMLGPWGDRMSYRIGYRPLRELLLAMHETGKCLKRISIAPLSHQFFEQDECTDIYHEVISNVQDLDIKINDAGLGSDKPEDDDEDDDLDDSLFDDLDDEAISALLEARFEARREHPHDAHRRVIQSLANGGLAAFLAAAPSLTALSISAIDEMQFVPEAVALEHIVGKMHWPHLATLALHNFRCRDSELVDFLQRHGETLQNLSLRNVTFTEGSAQSCFEPIAGKLPQLRRASLRGRLKAREFASPQEGDLYLSELSHYERPDARTRALQEYLVHGGQFPLEIIPFSRVRRFWWYQNPRTQAERLFFQQLLPGYVDEDDESSGSDSDSQPDVDENHAFR